MLPVFPSSIGTLEAADAAVEMMSALLNEKLSATPVTVE